MTTVNGLLQVYQLFLKGNNCPNFFQLLNKYSTADGILCSGDTSIAVEYKQRHLPVFKYETCLLERDKYNNLMTIAKLIDSNCALYICEYNEAVLIFDLRASSVIEWSTIIAPVSEDSKEYKPKECAFLKYSDASFIIAKKNWTRRTVEDLNYYIKIIRERNNLN